MGKWGHSPEWHICKMCHPRHNVFIASLHVSYILYIGMLCSWWYDLVLLLSHLDLEQLPTPMMTQIAGAIWPHRAGHNELNTVSDNPWFPTGSICFRSIMMTVILYLGIPDKRSLSIWFPWFICFSGITIRKNFAKTLRIYTECVRNP